MIADYMEPITGYRAWNVYSNGLLVGQNHAEPWPPYETFVGRCGHAISRDHVWNGRWMGVPVVNCSCGVYAYKEKPPVLERVEHGRESRWGYGYGIQDLGEEAMVWGEVKLWGKVIEHTEGYRAQFAYPGLLYCEDERLCGIVAKLYGVRCEHYPIERPKPVEDDDLKDYMRQVFATPSTHLFWRNRPVRPSAPSPALAPQLHVPSLTQIQALGATPWQQAQAQVQARQIPMLIQDWRDLWRNGFKAKSKGYITAPITFKGITLQPHPSQVAFLAGGRGKSFFINNAATLQKAMIDKFNLCVNLKAKS